VRAVGSFAQQPGCPEHVTGALSPETLERICRGERYNPSDTRRPITRVEVVRIRPQAAPGGDVAGLVEDPWRVPRGAPGPADDDCTAPSEERAWSSPIFVSSGAAR